MSPDPEVIKIASEQLGLTPITHDPIENLEPGIPKAKKILEENQLEVTDENIFIVASCEGKGVEFLKGNVPVNVRKSSGGEEKSKEISQKPLVQARDVVKNYSVIVNGESFQVSVGLFSGEFFLIASIHIAAWILFIYTYMNLQNGINMYSTTRSITSSANTSNREDKTKRNLQQLANSIIYELKLSSWNDANALLDELIEQFVSR